MVASNLRAVAHDKEEFQRLFFRAKLKVDDDAVDLSRVFSAGGVPMLADHDRTKFIGTVKDAIIDAGTLYVEPVYSDSEYAQSILHDIENNGRRGVSITANPTEMTLLERDDDDPFNDLMEFTKWELIEVSSVTVPALPGVSLSASTGVDEEPLMGVQLECSDEHLKELMRKAREAHTPNEVKEMEATTKDIREEILALGHEDGNVGVAYEYLQEAGEGANITDYHRKMRSVNVQPKPMREHARDNRADRGNQLSLAHLALHRRAPANSELEQRAAAEVIATKDVDVPQFALAQVDGGWIYVPDSFFSLTSEASNSATLAPGVADNYSSSIIARLHNRVRVLQYCNVTSGLVGDEFPITFRDTAAPSAVAESGSPTEADTRVLNVPLRPNRIAAHTNYTTQARIQIPDLERALREDMNEQFADQVSIQIVRGDGTRPNWLGVAAASGIAVAVNPSSLGNVNRGDLLDLKKAVFQANVNMANVLLLAGPDFGFQMEDTTLGSTGDNYLLQGGMTVGVPVQVNNALHGADSAAERGHAGVMGDFNYYRVGFWQGVMMLVDPYSAAASGKINVHFEMFGDGRPVRPEAFRRITFQGA